MENKKIKNNHSTETSQQSKNDKNQQRKGESLNAGFSERGHKGGEARKKEMTQEDQG